MFTEHVQSRREQREETRRKVLATADALFRRHGFAATTVRQIATEAGVSVGTVMSVGDKHQLLVDNVDGWIADRHAQHHPADDAPPRGSTLPDQVLAIFEPFIAYFDSDRELSREYGAIIVRGRHTSSIFGELDERLGTDLVGVLIRGGATPEDAESAATTIYFAYLGVLFSSAPAPVGAERDHLRAVITFVIRSITQEAVP